MSNKNSILIYVCVYKLYAAFNLMVPLADFNKRQYVVYVMVRDDFQRIM